MGEQKKEWMENWREKHSCLGCHSVGCILTKPNSVLNRLPRDFSSISCSVISSLQLGVFSLAEHLASSWSWYNNFECIRGMDGNNSSKVTVTFSVMHCAVVVIIDTQASASEVKRKLSCVFFSPCTDCYFAITEKGFL